MQPLLAGPRSDLGEADVLGALDVSRGAQVRWGVDVLHTDTLTPTGVTLDWLDGQVNWSYRRQDPLQLQQATAAQVRRTARLTFRDPGTAFNPVASLYQPWVELRAPHDVGVYGTEYPDVYAEETAPLWVRWNLGVFLPLMPPHNDDGVVVTRPLELVDRTRIYAQRELDDPLTVPAGTNVVEWISDDMELRFRETDVAGLEPSASTLNQAWVFDPDTGLLDVYNTLLAEIGYGQVFCNEDGRPNARPLEDLLLREPEWTYAPGGAVVTASNVEPVDPDLPNVLRFVAKRGPSLPEEGNGIRTVVNYYDGPASVTQRGRVVSRRIEVDAATQVELDAHARSASQYLFSGGGLRWRGQVGINPSHSDEDVVTLTKPRFGLDGTWLVTAWQITLADIGQMATMALTCEYLTGITFATSQVPSEGAFGTAAFGTTRFGG